MNLNSLFNNTLKARSQLINYQTFRWRRPRKPFWIGMAKSKLFIVPEPKVIPKEEKLEMKTLNRKYGYDLDSQLIFIRKTDPKLEIYSQSDEEGRPLHNPALEAEISKSFEDNAVWNAESAKRREERLKIREEQNMNFILEKIERKEEKYKKMRDLLDEIVRKEKISAKSFITPENIDEAIENCLNNIDDYDFAIDLQGNRYLGSKPLTSQLDHKVENMKSDTV